LKLKEEKKMLHKRRESESESTQTRARARGGPRQRERERDHASERERARPTDGKEAFQAKQATPMTLEHTQAIPTILERSVARLSDDGRTKPTGGLLATAMATKEERRRRLKGRGRRKVFFFLL